jgi:transposase InsO family protein
LKSDQIREYKCKAFTTYLEKEGIRHQFSATYTPQQNGVFERRNRTVVEAAGGTMQEKGVDVGLWAKAVHRNVNTKNSCPSVSTGGKAEFTLWFGTVPNI